MVLYMITQIEQRKVRLSITVNPELKELAKVIAEESQTTPSGIISRCLEDLAKKRKEDSMIRYYKAMAKEHKEFAKDSVKVIQKIASSWND